ncbi:hypothetical protein C4D60_Mb00t04870 [Musa balbisiana]|uniref:Uncharacterized protein n=1 Tax=Musa balbisiana TaxID=52838 RepID=A0A4S8I6Y3_MUSBA|nr:hypothetical protein C4D60_Mb00t04870 [Musa balbisiana]
MRNEGDESEYEYNKKRQKFDSIKDLDVTLFLAHGRRKTWYLKRPSVVWSSNGMPPPCINNSRPSIKEILPGVGLSSHILATFAPEDLILVFPSNKVLPDDDSAEGRFPRFGMSFCARSPRIRPSR